jgi:hypothetical protein
MSHHLIDAPTFPLSEAEADVLLQHVLPLALQVYSERANLAARLADSRTQVTSAALAVDIDDLANRLAVHFAGNVVELRAVRAQA